MRFLHQTALHLSQAEGSAFFAGYAAAPGKGPERVALEKTNCVDYAVHMHFHMFFAFLKYHLAISDDIRDSNVVQILVH